MSKKEISTARKVYLNTAHTARFLVRMSIAVVTLGWACFNAYFGMDSLAWPAAQGQLMQGRAGDTDIYYRYAVNGAHFQSSRVRFGDSMLVDSKAEFWNSYQQGTPLVVRYNPDDPSMSVLLAGFEKIGVFIPLGIGAFFFITAGVELRSRYLIR